MWTWKYGFVLVCCMISVGEHNFEEVCHARAGADMAYHFLIENGFSENYALIAKQRQQVAVNFYNSILQEVEEPYRERGIAVKEVY